MTNFILDVNCFVDAVHACKFYIQFDIVDSYNILASVCGINELTYENGRGLDEVVRWTAVPSDVLRLSPASATLVVTRVA